MCEIAGRDVAFWLLFGAPMVLAMWAAVGLMLLSFYKLLRN